VTAGQGGVLISPVASDQIRDLARCASVSYDFAVTSRERFHRVMAGEPVDRPPLWDDGIRDDVREAWATQGYPSDRALDDEFLIDRREQLNPNIYHREFDLCGDSDRHSDLPANDPRRYPDDWSKLTDNPDGRDYVVGLRVAEGLFLTLGVHAWDSLARLLYKITDHPSLATRTMGQAAEFTIRVVDRALDEVKPDYIVFSEPIASNSAPVVSPATFTAMCSAAYSRIVEHARRRGVRWVILQSYGNAKPLIGTAMAMGINAYWGGDTEAGSTRYLDLRKSHGTDLALVGGIDVGLLERDVQAAEAAIRETVSRLLAGGRYLPMLDGRVRSHVTFHAYANYRRTLQSLVTGSDR